MLLFRRMHATPGADARWDLTSVTDALSDARLHWLTDRRALKAAQPFAFQIDLLERPGPGGSPCLRRAIGVQ